eukprot:TRINITY_DN6120_c0_g1_i2.p1 TRINITY_DN6120_c0_g1~~TRINITY_DN6120_c0_g1_i2.p1  ORF type:complete len:174 (-),score=31.44 TRINITY_DN6120_c0_g1_i2:115-636(-)
MDSRKPEEKERDHPVLDVKPGEAPPSPQALREIYQRKAQSFASMSHEALAAEAHLLERHDRRRLRWITWKKTTYQYGSLEPNDKAEVRRMYIKGLILFGVFTYAKRLCSDDVLRKALGMRPAAKNSLLTRLSRNRFSWAVFLIIPSLEFMKDYFTVGLRIGLKHLYLDLAHQV